MTPPPTNPSKTHSITNTPSLPPSFFHFSPPPPLFFILYSPFLLPSHNFKPLVTLHYIRKGHPPLSLSPSLLLSLNHLKGWIYFFSQPTLFIFLSGLRVTVVHGISRGLLFLSFWNNIVCLRFSMLVLFPQHLLFLLMLFKFISP